ncbi:hypothetical protein CGCA056_v004308 [Colletotrichum aenigma]|uniref:uncharacterized protein n=1 Tax=Colletotrichum aenigma TaxID=1215731 RepID=UPI0018724999|nr:uncharacterized protein CGCA056_v004308 [Colletotrichum aenigma]KAF5523231.1 hypothetical protein CGCA056_v004308 [Colletotrichum aenigma]
MDDRAPSPSPSYSLCDAESDSSWQTCFRTETSDLHKEDGVPTQSSTASETPWNTSKLLSMSLNEIEAEHGRILHRIKDLEKKLEPLSYDLDFWSSYAQIDQLQVQGIALEAHEQFVKKRYFEELDVARFGAWLSKTETQYRWQARHLAHQKAVDICNYQVNKSDPDQGQLEENFMKFFRSPNYRPSYQNEKMFREQLAEKYHAGHKAEKKYEYWDPVLGKWPPHDRCRPVRLFPSRWVDIMDRIFGEGASKDIFSAYNELLTHPIIGRALDEGILALIPDEFDDAKGYQVVVIDYWHECLEMRLDRANPELGVTFLWELEGRMLSFRDDFRPKAQYMSWNYMSSAIVAAWRSKNTHGYYKSKIRVYVEDDNEVMIAGHHADPKIDDGFDPTKANHEAAAIIVSEQARRGIDDRDRVCVDEYERLGWGMCAQILDSWAEDIAIEIQKELLESKTAGESIGVEDWMARKDNHKLKSRMLALKQLSIIAKRRRSRDRWYDGLHKFISFFEIDDGAQVEGVSQEEAFAHIMCGAYCPNPPECNQRWDPVLHEWGGFRVVRARHLCTPRHQDLLDNWIYDENTPEQWLSAQNGLFIHEDIAQGLRDGVLCIVPDVGVDPDEFGTSWRKTDQRKRCRRVIDKQIQRACRHWGTWGYEIFERFVRDWLFDNDFLEAMIACERAYPGEHEVEKAEAEEAFKIFN